MLALCDITVCEMWSQMKRKGLCTHRSLLHKGCLIFSDGNICVLCESAGVGGAELHRYNDITWNCKINTSLCCEIIARKEPQLNWISGGNNCTFFKTLNRQVSSAEVAQPAQCLVT